MRTFTLDTNCLAAVDENRTAAAAVRVLAEAHAAGTAHVAVVGISASENQQAEGYIRKFADFRERLAKLGLAHLEVLKAMGYWNITFWDWCLYTSPDMEALERQIHTILFPNTEFNLQDYCRANGLDPKKSASDRKWRNRKCDVQAIWCHLNGQRDVFVTSDKNFHAAAKKAALIALGAKQIEYPQDAISLL